jgi:hypothetical protein
MQRWPWTGWGPERAATFAGAGVGFVRGHALFSPRDAPTTPSLKPGPTATAGGESGVADFVTDADLRPMGAPADAANAPGCRRQPAPYRSQTGHAWAAIPRLRSASTM